MRGGVVEGRGTEQATASGARIKSVSIKSHECIQYTACLDLIHSPYLRKSFK